MKINTLKGWDSSVYAESSQSYLRAFLDCKTDCYAVLQLKGVVETDNLRYHNYEWSYGWNNERGTPDFNHYEWVYGGQLRQGLSLDVDVLDAIWVKFNGPRRTDAHGEPIGLYNLPDDYYGHSMSCSDVIALKRDGTISFYFVNNVGFVKLPNFMPENIFVRGDITMSEQKNTSVYLHTASYARQTDQLSEFRQSRRENSACSTAIHKAISASYNYSRYSAKSSDALDAVKKEFSPERIAYVLAKRVMYSSWDARFSDANKQWAMTVPMVDGDAAGRDHNAGHALSSGGNEAHPGLINLFIDAYRKEFESDKQVDKNTITVLKVSPERYPQLVQLNADVGSLQDAVQGSIDILMDSEMTNAGYLFNSEWRDIVTLSQYGTSANEMRNKVSEFYVCGINNAGTLASIPFELVERFEEAFHQPLTCKVENGMMKFEPLTDEEVATIQIEKERSEIQAQNVATQNDPKKKHSQEADL